MYDYFCSDSNEMSETESEKQGEETLQKIKQERALQQYREKTDDVFFRVGKYSVFKRCDLVQVVGDQCDAR
jgi:predicted HAD superfamily phosphohydrolase